MKSNKIRSDTLYASKECDFIRISKQGFSKILRSKGSLSQKWCFSY